MALACFSIVLVSYVVIPAPLPNSNVPKDERHFDFLGFVTGILGLVMVNFAWNRGATRANRWLGLAIRLRPADARRDSVPR